MKNELLQVTPEIASKLLLRNTNNRNLSDRLVSKYAQDMKNGDWRVTHQGIAFYEDGSLADGQHRLLGIVRAGVPVMMYVTRGLPKDAAINIDIHRPRSTIDGIKIGELSDWIEAKHITMANLITHPKRLSTTETIKFLDAIESSARFATDVFSSNRRYLTSSVIQSALCVAHYNGEDPKMLEIFANVIYSGMPSCADEKIIVLARDAYFHNINNGAQDKQDKYYKTQRAIYAFCHGEVVKRLTTPKDKVYSFDGLF